MEKKRLSAHDIPSQMGGVYLVNTKDVSEVRYLRLISSKDCFILAA